jgi:hydrogenase maturation protease
VKILVAGVGNLLRGDDAFGVQVIQNLEKLSFPEGVKIVEVGISGVALVQELMERYDACIIADTANRGGAPGTLYLLEPEIEIPQGKHTEQLHRELVDMHYADPSRALLLAAALGVKPPQVYVLACQPAEVDEMTETLSPAVERAVAEAVRMIQELIARLRQEALKGKGGKETL